MLCACLGLLKEDGVAYPVKALLVTQSTFSHLKRQTKILAGTGVKKKKRILVFEALLYVLGENGSIIVYVFH